MKVRNEMIYSGSNIGSAQLSSVDFRNDEENTKNSTVQTQSDAAAMMSYLKETYKSINFNFSSFGDKRQIVWYGTTQKGTNNVTISPKLLEKMSMDESVRKHVEDILNHMKDYQNSARVEAMLCDKELAGMGLVIDEDGRVSKWTAMCERDKDSIYPKYWRDRESTSFYAKKKKSPVVSSYNYSHTSNMMRLANARDVKSVRGLIAAKYGEMQKVKAQVSDSTEAAAIVRKIKSVIQNGNLKIARLHKEENLELRRRAAERRLKEKMAQELAQELKKKRRARQGLEQCQTAHMEDVAPNSSVNDERFKQIAEQYVNSLPSAALSAETGAAVSADSSAGSVEVTVISAPVASLDCSA